MSREKVVKILESKFSNRVAQAYENQIFEMGGEYEKIAYEKVGQLLTVDKDGRKKISEDMALKRKGWESFAYKDIKNKQDIENDRIVNPPEVKKGIYKCKKCKSEKTWSYQLQTRSADEPMTSFITCVDCGKRWTE